MKKDTRTARELRDQIRRVGKLADAPGTPAEGEAARLAIGRLKESLAKLEGARNDVDPYADDIVDEQRDPFSVPDIYLTEEEKAAVVEVVERYRKMIQADIDARRAVNLDAYYLAYRSEVFRAIDRVRRAKDMDRMYRNGRGF